MLGYRGRNDELIDPGHRPHDVVPADGQAPHRPRPSAPRRDRPHDEADARGGGARHRYLSATTPSPARGGSSPTPTASGGLRLHLGGPGALGHRRHRVFSPGTAACSSTSVREVAEGEVVVGGVERFGIGHLGLMWSMAGVAAMRVGGDRQVNLTVLRLGTVRGCSGRDDLGERLDARNRDRRKARFQGGRRRSGRSGSRRPTVPSSHRHPGRRLVGGVESKPTAQPVSVADVHSRMLSVPPTVSPAAPAGAGRADQQRRDELAPSAGASSNSSWRAGSVVDCPAVAERHEGATLVVRRQVGLEGVDAHVGVGDWNGSVVQVGAAVVGVAADGGLATAGDVEVANDPDRAAWNWW